MQNNEIIQRRHFGRRLTTLSLLVFGIVMGVSGLYIQIYYHVLKNVSSGFNLWSFIHKWSALIFTMIVIVHCVQHLKWYKVVILKRLFAKNRIAIGLTIILILVSVLGFLSWVLSLFSTQTILRHMLIEIHDKIGLIFLGMLIGHIFKRWEGVNNHVNPKSTRRVTHK